jgi:hypothetical protein
MEWNRMFLLLAVNNLLYEIRIKTSSRVDPVIVSRELISRGSLFRGDCFRTGLRIRGEGKGGQEGGRSSMSKSRKKRNMKQGKKDACEKGLHDGVGGGLIQRESPLMSFGSRLTLAGRIRKWLCC